MHKTKRRKIQLSDRITATTETLSEILDCGRNTAVKIGDKAGARICIGRRVLWNVDKVQRYLDSIVQSE